MPPRRVPLTTADPLLPTDSRLEEQVLGGVILSGAEAFDKVAAILHPVDFSVERSRIIFFRLAALRESGSAIDRITLATALRQHNELDAVGGLAELLKLDEGLPELPNIEAYAKTLKTLSVRRQLMFQAQALMQAAQDTTQDVSALIASHSKAVVEMQPEDGESEDGRSPELIVTSFPGGISHFIDPSLRKRGLPTGFRKLDEMLGGGLQDGELIILAARPSVGKSAAMLNIAQHICLHPTNPKRCDVFSLEMSGESLITRLLCSTARVDSHKFRAGYLNADDRRRLQVCLNDIIESPIRIHDDFKKTLPGLVRRIRHAHKNGSKLIAIDYIQLMVTGSKSENRNLEISEIGRTIKLLSLELQMPMLVLSQIGRSADRRGGDQRPQLSDIKDSGSIEEHADTVLALYREELVKRDREDLKGLADLDILKQRNGPCSRIPLRFLGQYTRFENRVEDTEFPEQAENEPPPFPRQETLTEW